MSRKKREVPKFFFALLLVLLCGFSLGSTFHSAVFAAFESREVKPPMGYVSGNENDLKIDVEVEFHKLLQNWED